MADDPAEDWDTLEVTDPEALDALSEFRVPDDIDERPRAEYRAVRAADSAPGVTNVRFSPLDYDKTDADRAYGRAARRLSAAVARAVARDGSERPPVDLEDVDRVVGYLLAVQATVRQEEEAG